MKKRIYMVRQDNDNYGAWTLYRKIRFLPTLWYRIGGYSNKVDALERASRLEDVTVGTADELKEAADLIRKASS